MTLLAHQERAQGAPDTIFAYAGQAATRAAQVGRDNIVNATIGSFLNADGSLARRANAFLSEAKQVGLKPCPYQSGFFIYVPTPTDDDARRLAAELQKADVFTVPLGKGVRVAICAISEEKIAGLATLIHKDMQVLGL